MYRFMVKRIKNKQIQRYNVKVDSAFQWIGMQLSSFLVALMIFFNLRIIGMEQLGDYCVFLYSQ